MYDCIIVGMGPAGMSASIYSKRAGAKTLILEGLMPGGLLNKVSIVDNYLGFSGVTGPELSDSMIKSVLNENIEYKIEMVLSLIKNNDVFEITTNKNKYQSKSVVVSIGRKARKSGIINEEKYVGKGISYCAICDGPLFKNKKLVVIGGGNSALEESIYLSNITSDITILVRNKVKAQEQLINKAKELGIKIIENVTINNFYGDETLKGININDNENIDCDGCFIYIGYEANASFLNNFDVFDEKGYVLVDENMETKESGLFACGDIIKKDLYQIITAASEGAIAGYNASKRK